MPDEIIKKTNCHYCGYLCAFNAHIVDGKIIELTPDVTRYPYDERVAKRCRRWKINLEKLYSEERINYPMRRIGKRGSGKFERVSWDEAIADISNRLKKNVEKYGEATVASTIGGPHAVYWPLHRFMNLLGSPNNMGIGPICWNPRIWIQTLTFGWPIEIDLRIGLTGCLILWGTNPSKSDNSLFWQNVIEYVESGGKLIVVDPRETSTSHRATLHLSPRPGTDVVLAYGIARELIENNLIDKQFIDKWCYGFEEFKRIAYETSFEQVEIITGVPAQSIKEAARLFVENGPAALLSGRGVDQIGANTAPLHRALASLRAITGNVDVPGACSINDAPGFMSELELERSDALTDKQRLLGLNESEHANCSLQSYSGYKLANARTERLNKSLPMRYLTSAMPYQVWNAAITGKPYKISTLIVQAANPMVTYADTNLVRRALEAMELVVVLDYNKTPTGLFADYILPVAGAIERPAFQAMGGVSDFCYGGARAIEPQFERKEDYEIFRLLGLACGQNEKDWPAKDLTQELQRVLSKANVSWENFEKTGMAGATPRFYKHEEIVDGRGTKRGFATPSGKIELANELLDKMGAGRVARFVPRAVVGMENFYNGENSINDVFSDKSHFNSNNFASFYNNAFRSIENLLDDGIIILITGARTQPYWASCYFEVEEFRKAHPKPLIKMSAFTADILGLSEGDACFISRADEDESIFEVVQYVHISNMLDGVASAEYGWWYPEMCTSKENLKECLKSNINYLTRALPYGPREPLIGTWTYNGIPCKIRKA